MSNTSRVLLRIVAALFLFFSYFDFAKGEWIDGLSCIVLAIVFGAMSFERGVSGEK